MKQVRDGAKFSCESGSPQPDTSLVSALPQIPLFAHFKGPALERLAQGVSGRTVLRGEMIFMVGLACNEFHVVMTGQVKLFALSPQGQEKIIEIVGPGKSFAQAVMFLQSPYIVNAQALCDTALVSITRQALLREIELDPALSLRMLAGLSKRLHSLIMDVQAYSLESGKERVIGYLLRDLDLQPRPPHLRGGPLATHRARSSSACP